MRETSKHFGAPEWLILAGASVFILILGISAYWEADIRWLHFFQAWMYIATMALTVRRNKWGYFIGVSIAGFWDYATLFTGHFVSSGFEQLSLWIRTGQLARPDLVIAVPAWFSNLIIIIGCAWAYSRQALKPLSDVTRFVVSLVLATAFLAADMALFQPRYLAIFRRLMHPHWP